MEDLSPSQLRLRSRIEAGIGCVSPLLDAVLAIGDRVSRLAEPRDYEYYPVREEETPAGPSNSSRPSAAS